MIKIVLFFIRKHFVSAKREWKNFNNLFAVIGILISAAILTVAVSLFEGYETALRKVILGANSHIYVFKDGSSDLKKQDLNELSDFFKNRQEIKAYSPTIMTDVMLINNNRIAGAIAKGIKWKKEELPSNYKTYIKEGSYKLKSNYDAVLGKNIAKRLNVEIGDKIEITSALNTDITPMGLKSTKKTIRIVGFFKSGMYEYDNSYIYLNLETAKQLTKNNEVTMMEIALKEQYVKQVNKYASKYLIKMGMSYQFRTWEDYNANLFSLIKLEKWMMFIVLNFLVLIASFNLVSSILASIMEKKQEITILRTYGASNRFIKQLFMGKTLFIAGFAIFFGEILGLIIGVLIEKQQIYQLKADVYFLDKIQMHFNPIMLILIFLAALLIVYLCSLFPLKKIAKTDIIEILREKG